ncbi:unnamed protein product [Withania somnifera]
MGQGLSCGTTDEHGLFSAVQCGDLETLKAVLERKPSLIHHSTVYDRQSPLHIAAANGQIEVVSILLNQSINPDLLNRYKQTPLMLAAMHGKISCVEKLIEAGANILKFDSLNGRTCLHYAAYYGHFESLKAILSAARTSHIAASWGYTRFVNVRDAKGATPLHLAARQRRFPGSTPLHLAARGGSLDCIRELLAWGADRLHRDASGRIPYTVALRYHHGACAALLNPSSAEPLVWPSPLKFISQLNDEAKALLECALMEANKERGKNILKGTDYSPPSPSQSDGGMDDNISEVSDTEVCCICFDQLCTIEVQDCGHQMCAHCVLALCCHNKPNPATTSPPEPMCPFCRSNIVQLQAIKVTKGDETDRDLHSSKLRNSSFKGLSAVSSFGKMTGRGSGRIAAENEWIDKPLPLD